MGIHSVVFYVIGWNSLAEAWNARNFQNAIWVCDCLESVGQGNMHALICRFDGMFTVVDRTNIEALLWQRIFSATFAAKENLRVVQVLGVVLIDVRADLKPLRVQTRLGHVPLA